MKPDNRYQHRTGSATTVTGHIIHSESPLTENSRGPNHGSKHQESKQRQQINAAALSGSKLGSRTVCFSITRAEGGHEPCPGPVVHDRRMPKFLPPIRIHSGFEESPEWRQHYDLSSIPARTEVAYLPDKESRLLPDQSLTNTKDFFTETIITAQPLSDLSSIDAAEISPERRLYLPRPRSRQSLLKTGNNRLRQLIKPKHKSSFRTQQAIETERDTARQLQKLDLTTYKKDLLRRRSECWMERTEKEEGNSSQKVVSNKESRTSIIDLDQVEARHGLEEYHRTTLSNSWDEIFKTIGGFMADSDGGDDEIHHIGPRSHLIEVDANHSDLPTDSISPSKHEANKTRSISVESPLSSTPRTSNITAMVNGSPLRQSLQAVVAEPPIQATSTCRSKLKLAIQGNRPTAPKTNCLQIEDGFQPRLRAARSSEGLSTFGAAPSASQSSIALDAIEAQMNNGRPLSPSILTTPPFSVNCTPPQPVTAPSDPPMGPLPELPKGFDRADAASRASSYRSSSTRLSPPIVPPRSHHRQNPSANATGPHLMFPVMNSPKRHPHKHIGDNQKSPSSITNGESAIAEGRSERRYPQPAPALSPNNNVNISSFNQYSLGSTRDLQSPAASEAGQGKDMVDTSGAAAGKCSPASNDVLSSRSEHIKGLKLKDLAKEKAARICGQGRGSGPNDANAVKTPSVAAPGESWAPMSRPSQLPFVSERPSDSFHDIQTGMSRLVSRQASVPQRLTNQSPRGTSNRTGQRNVRRIMNQSQIMVLAETNPDTQMFRASTPTGSPRTTDSKKMKCASIAEERKVRKRKSKNGVCCQVHASGTREGVTGTKMNGEHTPPHSDPSTYSSDDDVEPTRGTRPYRDVSHIAGLVKEDSDFGSAPSKRALAALARREERKYFKEQQLLKKLKRESSELRLAMRLLSRGLEKLTTFVEVDDKLDEVQEHDLTEADRVAVRGMTVKSGPSISPDGGEGFDQALFSHGDARKHAKTDRDAGSHQTRSAWANDARPISLVSRYSSSNRNRMKERAIAGPPVNEKVIWDQVEGMNRAAMMSSGAIM